MEELNFDHAQKWKYTKLGAEFLGHFGEEYIAQIPNVPQLSQEEYDKLMDTFNNLVKDNMFKKILQPHLKIIHKPDGIYDVYNTDLNKWLFSFSSADNVFAELSKYGFINIECVDEVYDNE